MELLDRAASLGTAGWMLLLVAPFVGSFLGVVIRRLPHGRPLVAARSRCERCGVVLAARDLVPLISWFVLHGRCRHCGRPVGWFYPGIELASLAVAAIATAVHRPESAWLDCLLGWCVLALGWIDLRTGLLPDVLDLGVAAGDAAGRGCGAAGGGKPRSRRDQAARSHGPPVRPVSRRRDLDSLVVRAGEFVRGPARS